MSALDRVAILSAALLARRLMLVTAESCTGGLIAAAMTDRAGASAVFERGFVTYSNRAKEDMLAVPAALLKTHGAVSEPVSRAMAAGALAASPADLAIAVTGIAGPDSDKSEKPVGLVYIAVGNRARIQIEKYNFTGDRAAIRLQSRDAALDQLLRFLD